MESGKFSALRLKAETRDKMQDASKMVNGIAVGRISAAPSDVGS
jgi:hypothetical protein